MNLNDMLSNFNENQLQQVEAFLNSQQGKKMTNNLSQQKKDEILRQFLNLDPKIVKSKLNGISKEDILKFLK